MSGLCMWSLLWTKQHWSRFVYKCFGLSSQYDPFGAPTSGVFEVSATHSAEGSSRSEGNPNVTEYQKMWIIFSVVPCCMLFQSLLYCSNSCTSLHFKTLTSHTKILKIRPYMFQRRPKHVGANFKCFSVRLQCFKVQ